ncbi:HNH endonuclease signature motif containing protein [Amycolatopsis sp. NPDC051373]|uniref:HNH endonuclease n=1 Tax=Amycolatopsis sp. NPDC051373 TaxID=3155801 RepID=UPI00344B6076
MKAGASKKPVRRKYEPTEEPCKKIVKKRSEGKCEICGIRPGQSVHHRRKQSQGGPWTPSNCLHLCGDGRGPDGCHGMVTNTRTQYYQYGFLVYSGESWINKPVLYRGELVVLDDEGAWTPSLDFGQEAA